MEEQIYKLLNYIKKNSSIPQCEDLEISQERFNELVRRCNRDLLLDKKIIFVNIIGQVQTTGDADLGITALGLKFLDEYNPLGNVNY